MATVTITIKDKGNGRVEFVAVSVPPLLPDKKSPAQSIGLDALRYMANELVENVNITPAYTSSQLQPGFTGDNEVKPPSEQEEVKQGG